MDPNAHQGGAPPAIGFEMQAQDASYGGQGITPATANSSLYPSIGDNGPPPVENAGATSTSQVPIGFEGTGTRDQFANPGYVTYPSDERQSNVSQLQEHKDGSQPNTHKVALLAFKSIQVDAASNSPSEVINMTTPAKKEERGDTTEGAKLLQQNVPEENEIVEDETMFMRDGVRRIDFILAFSSSSDEKKKEKRKVFEDNLMQKRLQLERVGVERSQDGKTNFIKVHAPWEVLTKYAEIMNLKMPLHENDMEEETITCFSKLPITMFDFDEDVFESDPNYFTAPFSRERVDQFIIKSKESFFTNAQRSRIVYEILSRAVYEDDGEKSKIKFGIKRLLASGAYSAAYPLHEGPYASEHSIHTWGKENERRLLYEVWAKPSMFYKYQPLDSIRKYFGEKIGIYFCWLGYYTQMLIPAAVVGLACFIYGIATMFSDIPSGDICSDAVGGSVVMCPSCDNRCPYWYLKGSCLYSRVTYLFDNEATVFFATFMALWAAFFHEFWKRKQAEIEYDWDVANFEDEEETVRPEFEATVSHRKINPINRIEEPYLPSWSRVSRHCTTFSLVIFMLFVVLAAVVGVIVYRFSIVFLFYSSNEPFVRERASILTTITAALLSLVAIVLLNMVYTRIAVILTNLESHRTETEWEDSYTFKMFMFQFVNYYSSIFYIAFFKGRFTGSPGNFNYSLVNTRQEECDPSGCLIDLCIQLGIVMVGKQAFNNFKEIVLPKIKNWMASRKVKNPSDEIVNSRWEQDYRLAAMPDLGLFEEYLEMVVQFGFVTIFVAAFPLAPLFALLNNIIEIRLDAYKFVTQWRRPLAKRTQDIGIWYPILRGITVIAILSNAFIIALTSDFIPKLVYKYVYSADGSLTGYIQDSLSTFNISDFEHFPDTVPPEFANLTECRYRAYREPPGGPREYEYTMEYWHVFAARMAFVLVFENVVVFAVWLVAQIIPDVPGDVKVLMLREKFLAKEALFQTDVMLDEQEKNKGV